jgi:hypothetical protein
MLRSAIRPISPPSASISRTSWPFASRRCSDCTADWRPRQDSSEQQRRPAEPCAGECRFGAGMAAPITITS